MTKAQTRNTVKPWIRTLLILPAYLFIVGFFQLAAYLFLGNELTNIPSDESPVQEIILALFTLWGTIVVVGIFRRHIDLESFRSMGFYVNGFSRESITGLGLGAIIMATGFSALVFGQEIQWTGTNMEYGPFILGFGLFVLVALSEELLFRGYVLNNLMKSMNRLNALLMSSLFFTLMHSINPNFSWMSFWNILLAGILIGLPYIFTKSLWLPIALHFSWNFFQGTIFGFNVSGQDTYSVFTQLRTADTIWNGGAFGFEGSALSIVLELIAIGGMWRYCSRKEKINEINHAASPSGEEEAEQETG